MTKFSKDIKEAKKSLFTVRKKCVTKVEMRFFTLILFRLF